MTKIISQTTFVAALFAGLLTVVGCGAATADPTDTTPQAETSGTPVAQNGQQLAAPAASGSPHRGPGAHGRGDPDKFFQMLDKDGDGKVLLTDIPEPMRDHLAKADTNQDGALTRDELKAAHEAQMAEWKKKLDTNGDGTVSKEERAAGRAQFEAEMKKKLDTNGDGTVSEEEKAAARAKFEQGFVSHFDKNKDGALTSDEVPAQMWTHLVTFDANKDGKLDATELAAAHAAHRDFDKHHGGPGGNGPDGDDDGQH
jgi:Ca2+-binding EF-hand superfamily protein